MKISSLCLLFTSSLSFKFPLTDFQWCYEGKCGPQHWHKYYKECGGRRQSPINIDYKHSIYKKMLRPLHFKKKVRSDPGYLENNGHSLETSAKWGVLSGGELKGSYRAVQFHFHWGPDDNNGSEHTVGGRRFPLEMHVVHNKIGVRKVEEKINKMGEIGIAVAAFLFEISTEDNDDLTPFVERLREMTPEYKSNITMENSLFEIADLLGIPSNGEMSEEHASYIGSLTTPECTEGVRWIVFLNPLKISSSQLSSLRGFYDFRGKRLTHNFRDLQKTNGRRVTIYM